MLAFVPATADLFDGSVAFAADDLEKPAEVTLELENQPITASGMDDPEQLLEDYLLQSGQEELQSAGINPTSEAKPKVTRGSKLTGPEKKLYDLLKAKIELVASGEKDTTVFQFVLKDIFGAEAVDRGYSAEDLGQNSLLDQNGTITDEAWDALGEKILETIDVQKVYRAILYDEPYALYWFDKTPTGGMVSLLSHAPCRVENSDEVRIKPTDNSGLVCIFVVSQEFRPAENEPYYLNDYEIQYPVRTNTTLIDTINAAINNAAGVVADSKELSDYNKLVAYRNWICNEVTYNDAAQENAETPYGNPWQMIYVFDKDEKTDVVCEGYSKAFKYLCDLSEFNNEELNCFIATGVMSCSSLDNESEAKGAGGHMWNIIHMGDNDNYLVDITNCDTNTVGYPDKLFMVGKAMDPSSNATDESYTFSIDNALVMFAYDANTIGIFDASERTLAQKNYENTSGNTGDTGNSGDTDDQETEIVNFEISGLVTNKTYTGSAIKQNLKITANKTKTLTEGTDYTVAYKNNVNVGKATVTVTYKGDYQGAEKMTLTFTISPKTIKPTVTLSGTKYTYTGKLITPKATVKYAGKTLPASQYTVSYASGRKAVGNYKVTVTMKGNYKGSNAATFNIIPKTATILAPTAAKKSFTARWAKQLTKMNTRQITGYQVQCSTVSTFKSGVKTVTAAGATKSSVKVGALKAKTNYYVRVRTYMKIGTKTYYSNWSAVKKVKTK